MKIAETNKKGDEKWSFWEHGTESVKNIREQ
jgi:hypothetical protein